MQILQPYSWKKMKNSVWFKNGGGKTKLTKIKKHFFNEIWLKLGDCWNKILKILFRGDFRGNSIFLHPHANLCQLTQKRHG